LTRLVKPVRDKYYNLWLKFVNYIRKYFYSTGPNNPYFTMMYFFECCKNANSVDNDDGDSVNPVWCFLENIRDPANPASGCYPDTTWSPRDGRFWSAEACKGLPPLDTDDALITVTDA
jgi:hypothetical protein